MLDKRSFALLEYINAECGDGGYKIFSTAELAAVQPLEPLDGQTVVECVKTLAQGEYISVKYQDEREVCIMPLSKGRLAFERRLEDKVEKMVAAREMAIYAFLGGGAGGVLAALIIAFLSAVGVL